MKPICLTAALLLGIANAKVLDFQGVAKLAFGEQEEVQPAPPEDMLVIGAGLGRTGTTSFVEAMHRLGLKTYHMVEGVIETPGHAALWGELSEHYQQTKSVEADKIMDKMAADGFNATSDFPACLIYKELFERYPEARVVLTIRGGNNPPAEWASSGLETIWQMSALSMRLPMRWVPELDTIAQMTHKFMFPLLGMGPADPVTNLPEVDALAKAYDEWIDRVKQDVPADKLLIFKPQDGWQPLCEFLSPVAISIEATCDKILAAKEPYPFVNDKAKLKLLVFGLTCMANLFQCLPVLVVLVGLVLFFRKSSSRTKDKKQ